MNAIRVKALMIGITVAWSTVANADLGDALDAMFLATGNEPAIYASQRRGGVDFGTLRLRAPVTSVNVLNLTAPNIRAGCGGIDIYGGSFTFINTEQFRQVLRQIGANAIGYAFKLALATMCEPCDRHLTTLQDMMNKINAGNLESCRWAQGIVNDLAGSLPFKENIKGMTEESAIGTFDDMVEASQDLFANINTMMGRGDPSGADPNNPDVGNITWNALEAANVQALFTFPDGNITTQEVLLNIAGSWMVRAPSDADIGAGRRGNVSTPLPAILSYRELISGKDDNADSTGDALQLYDCGADIRCLNPQDNLAEWSFEGVEAWVETNLQAAADHMANPATAGTDHPAAIQEFLGGLPLNAMKHMLELQGGAALNVYVEAAGPYIAEWYGVTMAKAFAGVIRKSFASTNAPVMTPNILANLEVFEADVKAAELRILQGRIDKIKELDELVESLRQEQQNLTPQLVGDQIAE